MSHTYDFDEDYQFQILVLMLKDPGFNQRTEGLIKPEYFSDAVKASMARVLQDYWAKYKRVPAKPVIATVFKRAKEDKVIRDDLFPDVIALLKEALAADVSDRDFVVDGVEAFAQHQAMENSILECAEIMETTRDYEAIRKSYEKALMVGAASEAPEYDFFKRITDRTEIRKEKMAGTFVPQGITTGIRQIDNLLYHKGWGRRELSCLMGPPKSGKSMGLIGFAINAALHGHNVAYLSCEVAKEIIAERSDANLSDTPMGDLVSHMAVVKDRIDTAAPKCGHYHIFDYPSGSLRPSDVRRFLNKAQSRGIRYDLAVIDYADIMAPDHRSGSPIEDSKQIYLGLRAIAHEFDLAVLTATQTNREGFRATVAGMEHVAEDINKVRTVDILISINATEDERARGEARLYIAASRNQGGDITVRVNSAKEKGKLISRVLEVL